MAIVQAATFLIVVGQILIWIMLLATLLLLIRREFRLWSLERSK